MSTQLNYVESHFYSKLGLSIVSTKEILTQKLKESNRASKDDFKLKKKVDQANFLESKKTKIQSYFDQQKFISDQRKNLSCKKCTNCHKANCPECCEKFYMYKLLYTKTGEYNRKTNVVFTLLAHHIENSRKKANLISYLGTPEFPFSPENQRGIVKEKNVNYLTFLEKAKKQAALKKELYFPSYIINIAFLEFMFSPLGLNSTLELIHPNYNYIGNAFIGQNENKHSNKNIKNIFYYYTKQIKQVLIVADNQFSTNRSQKKAMDDFIKKLQSNLNIIPDTLKFRELLKNDSYIQEASNKFNYKKPNNLFANQFTNKKLHFKNTSDINQVFPDTSLSGVLLFRLYSTNVNFQNSILAPPKELRQFINSFTYDDSCLTKLSDQVTDFPLQYEEFNHVFSFHGFGIYHSYLSLNSILTKYKTYYDVKTQFHCLQLSELTEKGYGTNLIKFALFQYTKRLSQTDPTLESLQIELNETLKDASKKKTIDFCFPVLFQENLGSDKNYIDITMPFSSFTEMKELAKNKDLKDDYYTLISLRFTELVHFFNYTDFEFNNLQKRELKNVDSDFDFKANDTISKSMLNIISNEIFRFMILKAALLTQVEWINQYQLRKCEDERMTERLLHTIRFRSVGDPKLKLEKSDYKYFKNSIFSFPPAAKDKDCTLLVNIILSNIKDIEEKACE